MLVPRLRRTLLITNDFPPRAGGIQSYVHTLADRLPADRLTVVAPRFLGDSIFDAQQRFSVFREPGLLVPGRALRQRVVELIRDQRIDAVWYGARRRWP